MDQQEHAAPAGGRDTARLLVEGLLDALDHTPFEQVTVPAIVASAGVGQGTLYRRFGSKDRLLATAFRERVVDPAAREVEGASTAPAERAEAYVVALTRHMAEHRALTTAMAGLAQRWAALRGADLRDDDPRSLVPIRGPLLDALAEARAGGGLAPAVVEFSDDELAGTVVNTALVSTFARSLSPDATARLVVTVVLAPLFAPAGAPRLVGGADR